LAVLLIGAQFLGASTLQSYGLALFVGLLSGAYSSIFIASPVLSMMKEREPRWVDIANRLAKRGDTGAFYSAVDAANLSTQMSVAAAGQAVRGAGSGSAAARPGATKRSGLIRPGSGNRPGGGSGTGGGGGTETAVMDRPSDGGSGSSGQTPSGPRPRKSKGKRKR
jgi:preprotein translocase subunit SecF